MEYDLYKYEYHKILFRKFKERTNNTQQETTRVTRHWDNRSHLVNYTTRA